MNTADNLTVILEPVDRHGRSRASLPDGTILVESSRQPFLEAARVLMAAGHSPDSWLEGWRPGSSTWALRARLGIAAGLTVDESKTVFAKWKPFSRSAVSPPIRANENVAPDPGHPSQSPSRANPPSADTPSANHAASPSDSSQASPAPPRFPPWPGAAPL
jgi:hypothetical protein